MTTLPVVCLFMSCTDKHAHRRARASVHAQRTRTHARTHARTHTQKQELNTARKLYIGSIIACNYIDMFAQFCMQLWQVSSFERCNVRDRCVRYCLRSCQLMRVARLTAVLCRLNQTRACSYTCTHCWLKGVHKYAHTKFMHQLISL